MRSKVIVVVGRQLGNLRAEYVEYLLLLASELVVKGQFLHLTWLNGTFDLNTVWRKNIFASKCVWKILRVKIHQL